MRIGLCGLGTVGSAVFNLVQDNGGEIERKTGKALTIAQVGCRRDHPDVQFGNVPVTRDVLEVVRNPDVDIVLELIGGTDIARELVLEAIANGKHVVTANKALVAEFGHEIFEAAEAAGVQVRYEAAVAGGIPIIKAVREGLSANRIAWIAGIINGTTNYILTEMEQPGSNLAFDDVLKEAQRLGYAEADPTFDVEGIDAAHKLIILSAVGFGVPLAFDAIYTEGITAITSQDIRYADELGYRIRHLGITRLTDQGVQLRVHPTLIAKGEMLAQVDGVMNAVMVGSDAANATMYYGPGAGGGPTASSVLADVVDLLRGGEMANLGYTPDAIDKARILSIDEIISEYYLRMEVLDQPGVMARLTTILSEHDISIEALIQKDAHGNQAEVVLVTSEVLEKQMNDAIAALQSLPQVTSHIARIRVTSLTTP